MNKYIRVNKGGGPILHNVKTIKYLLELGYYKYSGGIEFLCPNSNAKVLYINDGGYFFYSKRVPSEGEEELFLPKEKTTTNTKYIKIQGRESVLKSVEYLKSLGYSAHSMGLSIACGESRALVICINAGGSFYFNARIPTGGEELFLPEKEKEKKKSSYYILIDKEGGVPQATKLACDKGYILHPKSLFYISNQSNILLLDGSSGYYYYSGNFVNVLEALGYTPITNSISEEIFVQKKKEIILKPKPNTTTMSTSTTTNIFEELQTKEFFGDKKNIKAIKDIKAGLKESLVVITNVGDKMDTLGRRAASLVNKLDLALADNSNQGIASMMKDYPALIAYLKEETAKTIDEAGKEPTKKVPTPEEYFTD